MIQEKFGVRISVPAVGKLLKNWHPAAEVCDLLRKIALEYDYEKCLERSLVQGIFDDKEVCFDRQ